jgi:hypothetical protein
MSILVWLSITLKWPTLFLPYPLVPGLSSGEISSTRALHRWVNFVLPLYRRGRLRRPSLPLDIAYALLSVGEVRSILPLCWQDSRRPPGLYVSLCQKDPIHPSFSCRLSSSSLPMRSPSHLHIFFVLLLHRRGPLQPLSSSARSPPH